MRIHRLFRTAFCGGVDQWVLRSRRTRPETPDPVKVALGQLAYEGEQAEEIRCRAFAEKATASMSLDQDKPL